MPERSKLDIISLVMRKREAVLILVGCPHIITQNFVDAVLFMIGLYYILDLDFPTSAGVGLSIQ